MTKVNEYRNVLYILQIESPSIDKINISDNYEEKVLEQLKGVPDGVQIDRKKGVIYWTNMGEDFNKNDGSIESMNLDGTNRKLLIGRGRITTPKQLVLDEVNDILYWCDREGGKVSRCRTNGEEFEVLVDRGQGQFGVVGILEQCVGICLDKRRGKIYWTQKGPPKGGEGKIFSANIDMPDGENAINRTDIILLRDNLPEPIDLEMDVENDELYWTDRGAEPNGNSLNRAAFINDALSNHEVLFTGFDEAIGLALDIKNNHVYVSDLGGNVHRLDLNGDNHKVIYTSGSLTGIVIA
ncbi:hypothetical protein [Serratia surfactantfaciens]|uniref:hypothetical protein n=1 Tax=Serratia surfactantfaciens TaxID=2741499 RepID=UPI003EDE9F97